MSLRICPACSRLGNSVHVALCVANRGRFENRPRKPSGWLVLAFLVTCLGLVAFGTGCCGVEAKRPPRAPAPEERAGRLEAAALAPAVEIRFAFNVAGLPFPADQLPVPELDIPFVVVEGHADVRGPAAYNRALSRRRAQAVARALVAQGVPEAGVQVEAKGASAPLCRESNEECHARNRRVVVYTIQGGSRHP